MRNIKFSLLTIFVLISCSGPATDCRQAIDAMRKELAAGNLRVVNHLADSVKKSCAGNRQMMQISDSLNQIAGRIALDFSLSGDQITGQIKSRTGSFSEGELENWEKKGWLEGRLINGEKMYFNRAVSNLLLLKKFYEQKETRLRENAEDPEMTFRLKHTAEACKLSGKSKHASCSGKDGNNLYDNSACRCCTRRRDHQVLDAMAKIEPRQTDRSRIAEYILHGI